MDPPSSNPVPLPPLPLRLLPPLHRRRRLHRRLPLHLQGRLLLLHPLRHPPRLQAPLPHLPMGHPPHDPLQLPHPPLLGPHDPRHRHRQLPPPLPRYPHRPHSLFSRPRLHHRPLAPRLRRLRPRARLRPRRHEEVLPPPQGQAPVRRCPRLRLFGRLRGYLRCFQRGCGARWGGLWGFHQNRGGRVPCGAFGDCELGGVVGAECVLLCLQELSSSGY